MFARVFITGASRGIGQALALRLAKPGVALGLVARSEAPLREVGERVEARGARAICFAADVGDSAAMKDACARFLEAEHGVDLVVANAGTDRPQDIRAGDLASVLDVFQTNLSGVANTVVPFVPSMLAAGSGTLVAVGSIAGFRALPRHAAYCASKAAVTTFMDGVRMDLAGTGVHAMTVCPGFVRTEMTRGAPHPMPFSMDVEAAVDEILGAVERRARTHAFPGPMRALKLLMTLSPEPLLRRVTERAQNR
jgi:short-subunit dehydrogenase